MEPGPFIIQQCPTYFNERWSRRILNEINIYCLYCIVYISYYLKTWLLLLEDDNFIEKNNKRWYFVHMSL